MEPRDGKPLTPSKKQPPLIMFQVGGDPIGNDIIYAPLGPGAKRHELAPRTR